VKQEYDVFNTFPPVLGSARTGLIFTGIQEGAQTGRLTPPGQTEQSIPYHAGFRWGERDDGNSLATQERMTQVRSGTAALWVMRFVLCFLLICIVVVPVPFVCCSVKLPLSRPTSFCLFLSILLCTPAAGGAAAWRFCCQPQPNHNTPKVRLSGDCDLGRNRFVLSKIIPCPVAFHQFVLR